MIDEESKTFKLPGHTVFLRQFGQLENIFHLNMMNDDESERNCSENDIS